MELGVHHSLSLPNGRDEVDEFAITMNLILLDTSGTQPGQSSIRRILMRPDQILDFGASEVFTISRMSWVRYVIKSLMEHIWMRLSQVSIVRFCKSWRRRATWQV
jgi:hypothetical protein